MPSAFLGSWYYPRVQLSLPWPSARDASRRTLAIGGRTYQVAIARHRGARRYLLRVADDGSLRLTVPRGASIAEGLAFTARQAQWIERERIRRAQRLEPWRDGSIVLFRGREEALRVTDAEIGCGPERIRRAHSSEDVRHAVESHWRTLAERELPARCLDLAAQHALAVARVSIRNQRSRWGACSPRGAITLNWRLVQMPAAVSDYVVLHELVHLRQANHSRRFWREVAAVCPGWRDCERWLRRRGREIL